VFRELLLEARPIVNKLATLENKLVDVVAYCLPQVSQVQLCPGLCVGILLTKGLALGGMSGRLLFAIGVSDEFVKELDLTEAAARLEEANVTFELVAAV